MACRPGTDCFLQNAFDHDPGPGARDWRCGGHTYDRHDGSDIRLPTVAAARAGVDVLAAAAGTVRSVRDGMPDTGLAAADRASLAGRECGNGVVIAHPDGWETQYCHMARGSIAVRAGQNVAAGARLGQVGLSGSTDFPHLHFSVRHGVEKIDPFAPAATPGQCGGGAMLWAGEAGPLLAGSARAILNTGFSAAPVTMDGIEQATLPAPTRGAAALIVFVRAIGLDAGDRVTVRLSGPDGREIAAQTGEPLPRAKAQWLVFAGRRRPVDGWPPGRYAGFVAIDGTAGRIERQLSLDLR